MSPAFNRLWSANIFSNLADGFGKTAFPLLAISLTRDPVYISMIGALVMLPWLLLAIPIGTVIDNVNKKNALALANSIRAAIAAILAVAISTDFITIHWLLLIAFAVGICEVIADTASQSLIPTIVNNKDLEKANSRFEMTFTIIQDFVGAPLGGLLYGIAIYIPFIANGTGFAIAALMCFLIPLPFVKTERVHEVSKFDTFKSDLRFGISFLWNHKDLKRLVLTTTAIGFCFSFANATNVLFLVDELGLKEEYFGIYMSAFGLFALTGAFMAPKNAERFGRGQTLAAAISLSCVAMPLTAFVPNIWIFLFIGFAEMYAITHWNILLMATYQRLIPTEIYARVHGARRTLVWGSMPVASFLGGWVAKATNDLRFPWLLAGTVAVIVMFFNTKFIVAVGNSVVNNEA